MKTTSSVLLINPMEGKTFAEVLRETRYKIELDDSGAEVSFIRENNGSGVLTQFSSVEPMYSLDFDCLTEKIKEVECQCPEEINTRMDITSVNSQSQKLDVEEAAEKYAWKLSHSGKIRISM